MSITSANARVHLGLGATSLSPAQEAELALLVASVNEWVAARVIDTTTSSAQLGSLFLLQYWWRPQRGPANADDEIDDLVTFDGATFPNRVLQLLGLGPYATTFAAAAPVGCFPDARDWPDPVEWC